jgi:phosphate/sulfate permease
MAIFFSWIIFSFVAGAVGAGRKIGFWGALLLSLILSPLVGLIVAFASKSKEAEKYEKVMLETQQKQQEALENMKNQQVVSPATTVSLAEELEKIKNLKENGFISDEEYQKLKDKIINA